MMVGGDCLCAFAQLFSTTPLFSRRDVTEIFKIRDSDTSDTGLHLIARRGFTRDEGAAFTAILPRPALGGMRYHYAPVRASVL